MADQGSPWTMADGRAWTLGGARAVHTPGGQSGTGGRSLGEGTGGCCLGAGTGGRCLGAGTGGLKDHKCYSMFDLNSRPD